MKRLLLTSAAAALMLGGSAIAQDAADGGVPVDPEARNAYGPDETKPDKPVADTPQTTGVEWDGTPDLAATDDGERLDPGHYQTQGEDESAMQGSDRMNPDSFDRLFNSRLHQAYSAIDADGNASVSRAEWGDWQADDGFYAERFDLFDGNGDDAVSWAEYRDAVTSLYDVRG